MDLKGVLLRSISNKELIKKTERLFFGNRGFVISYEVHGKYLFIKNIRQILGYQERRRSHNVRKRLLLTTPKLSKRWQGEPHVTVEVQVQTDGPLSACISTQTQVHTNDKMQQTFVRQTYMHGTQTETTMEPRGMQTEKSTSIQAVQTERYSNPIAVQTELKVHDMHVQTKGVESFDYQMQTDSGESKVTSQVEIETVVLLLNEIGEMIMNQNHLLHNNSTLLGQMTEMSMLQKTISQKNISMKQYLRSKNLKIRKRSRKRRIRYIFLRPKPKMARNAILQTRFSESHNISTQTYDFDFPKKKKPFSFL